MVHLEPQQDFLRDDWFALLTYCGPVRVSRHFLESLVALQVALEARETAAATLGALQAQGVQMQRVNRDLDEVHTQAGWWYG